MKEKKEIESPHVQPQSDEPRAYVGPTPAPYLSGFSCGCQHYADDLSRAMQDELIARNPETAVWFQ